MEILEIKQRKLVASEGKVIVLKNKEPEFDEEGNEIIDKGAKIIYLAINSNPDDYEEIDEIIEEPIEE